jgi:hypothetical protein
MSAVVATGLPLMSTRLNVMKFAPVAIKVPAGIAGCIASIPGTRHKYALLVVSPLTAVTVTLLI